MLSSSGFRDALGERDLVFDREGGAIRERLLLRPELAAFESAVRRRIGRLASLEDPRLLHVEGVERDRATGRLAVLSRHASGQRLSQVLADARERELIPDMTIALWVAAEVLSAADAFHSLSGLPHGAVSADRIVVTPEGETLLADYAYAEVIEAARFSPKRLWDTFGIAYWLGAPFSFDADVRHAALVAIALMLGRPLDHCSLPGAFAEILTEVEDAATIRGGRLFAEPVMGWLKRAVGTGTAEGFSGAAAAAEACQALLTDRERAAARPAFEQFISDAQAAIELAGPELREEPAIESHPPEIFVVDEVLAETAVDAASAAPAFDNRADVVEERVDVALEPVSDEDEAFGEPPAALELEREEEIEPEAVAVAETRGAMPSNVLPFAREEETEPDLDPEPVAIAGAPDVGADRAGVEAEAQAIEPEAQTVPAEMPAPELPQSHSAAFEWAAPAPEPDPIVSVEAATSASLAPDAVEASVEPVGAPSQVSFTASWAPPTQSPVDPPTDEPRAGASRVTSPNPFAVLKASAPPPVPSSPAPMVPLPVIPPSMRAPAPAPVAAAQPVDLARVQDLDAGQPSAAPIRLKHTEPEPKGRHTRVELSDRPVPISFSSESEGERRWFPIPRKFAAAAALVLVTGLAAGKLQWPASNGEAAVPPGTLVVETTPPGSEVFINGEARGATPALLNLPPGRHEIKLARNGATHAWMVEVASGARRVERLDWRALYSTGGIEVVSNVQGSKVFVDGKVRGETPLTVTDLKPGRHTVVVRGPNGNVRRTVRVVAGETTRLDLAIYSGWVVVTSTIELQVVEKGRAIGTAGEGPLVLSAGTHTIDLVNEALSYRSTHILEIAPGEEKRIVVEPKGELSANALPWAEVWFGDRRLGETPLANVPVPLGTQEIVFRHPEYGERRVPITVTGAAPVQVTVDMTTR